MRASDIDRALTLSANDAIERLQQLPEGQWFDRESGRVRAKDLAPLLSAFGNAEGGVVIVGLHGSTVEGVSPERINELRQASFDHVQPPVRLRVEELTCRLTSGQVGVVLVLRVDPGESVHEVRNGDCYLRVRDETRKLSFARRQELSYDRGSAPYDGTPSGTSRRELSDDQLESYRLATGASSTELLLRNRSLLTSGGDVTIAAHLLFGQAPQQSMPHALVRILRYRDVHRGAGRTFSLGDDDDVRCQGTIPQMISTATDEIDKRMPRRRVLSESGRFEGEPIVPRDAWLEGLVNAVTHRSYSAAGDHVRVEIFPDRLEIESPGRFPGLGDPESPLDIPRYSRNPRITRVCTDLRISQERGEGVRRIFAEMRRRGLTDPLYRQTAGSVRLVLSASPAIPVSIRTRLPRGAETTLDALRQPGRALGTGQVMELTGASRPTVLRHLNALRDEGLVEWMGQSPKDPRALWQVG